MKKFLAIVETVDEVDGSMPIDPLSIRSVQPIPHIDPSAFADVNTFVHHWFSGIVARNDWESFSENFFQILTKSGMVDEHGAHFLDYDFGSICRAALTLLDAEKAKRKADRTYKSPLLEFVDTNLGMMVLASVKGAGKMFRKGKELKIDWVATQHHWAPMVIPAMEQMIKTRHRADIMAPLVSKFLIEAQYEGPATEPQPATAE